MAPPRYQVPPKPVVDVLDTAPPPRVELSPTGEVVALIERASMPTIAEFSQPFVRAAGYRLNPITNGAFRPHFARA